MSNAQGKPLAIVCATALALAVPPVQAYVRGEGPVSKVRWNTFTADVTIRRGLHDETGKPIGNGAPPLSYRWERTQAGGRWKTTMTMVTTPRPEVVTPTGEMQVIPPAVARIEDDDDGTGPRFYSAQGSLLRLPVAGDQRWLPPADVPSSRVDVGLTPRLRGGAAGIGITGDSPDWVQTIVPSLDKRGTRRASLQRRFGKAVGMLRGRDRYVQTIGDETTEVLADETWAVPVEVNVVRGGVLRSHASFVYDRGPDGALVRRASHAEQAVEGTKDGKASRMVLDIELAHVQLEERR